MHIPSWAPSDLFVFVLSYGEDLTVITQQWLYKIKALWWKTQITNPAVMHWSQKTVDFSDKYKNCMRHLIKYGYRVSHIVSWLSRRLGGCAATPRCRLFQVPCLKKKQGHFRFRLSWILFSCTWLRKLRREGGTRLGPRCVYSCAFFGASSRRAEWFIRIDGSPCPGKAAVRQRWRMSFLEDACRAVTFYLTVFFCFCWCRISKQMCILSALIEI